MTSPYGNEAEAAVSRAGPYGELYRSRAKPRLYDLWGKRLLDVAGALAGLIVLSPAILLIALAVKLSDPGGPILFRQNRIGKDYKTFRIYKFRSMVHNAEEVLKRDPKLHAKYILNNYKLDPDEDPRITAIGRILRKTSLDEIPQLFNVLAGSMSLVGPRPVVREELDNYGDRASELLSVQPGVTGYWQVSGRSNVGYPERADLELHYVSRKSLRFDLSILLRTVLVVLLRRGAY
ncbi:exopolysaccharide biosynthesis protein [Cohnella xylanilytica]|uniref:Sugar transferase n=1 Tax=Cohnella xylanilytica TaxID=557555 RepID=A0A841TWC8_9BACL|nr:sugar transferase [Cohnella xylanilytica]MBB6692837.1 sugar transferase [Cohnella xylanilytica]GIO10603.1 exopolysaccharide biosynthesis protein [Cohnella xylanilytica]